MLGNIILASAQIFHFLRGSMMNISQDTKRIAVIGGGKHNSNEYDISYSVGSLIARAGAILVCGGEEGILEAACKGAYENGGVVIGIRPDLDPSSVNPYVHIPIFTSLGFLRNALVVANCNAVVALSGSNGTLSEIAYALQLGKKVLSLGNWELPGVIRLKTPQDAVGMALSSL